jgi:hypothetical protein
MVTNYWSFKIMVGYTYGMQRGTKYKDNEYIRCIHNTGYRRFVVLQDNTAVGIPIEFDEIFPLTIGHKYKVIHHALSLEDDKVFIENDLGIKENYDPNFFIKLSTEEWRDFQLERLLK